MLNQPLWNIMYLNLYITPMNNKALFYYIIIPSLLSIVIIGIFFYIIFSETKKSDEFLYFLDERIAQETEELRKLEEKAQQNGETTKPNRTLSLIPSIPWADRVVKSVSNSIQSSSNEIVRITNSIGVTNIPITPVVTPKQENKPANTTNPLPTKTEQTSQTVATTQTPAIQGENQPVTTSPSSGQTALPTTPTSTKTPTTEPPVEQPTPSPNPTPEPNPSPNPAPNPTPDPTPDPVIPVVAEKKNVPTITFLDWSKKVSGYNLIGYLCNSQEYNKDDIKVYKRNGGSSSESSWKEITPENIQVSANQILSRIQDCVNPQSITISFSNSSVVGNYEISVEVFNNVEHIKSSYKDTSKNYIQTPKTNLAKSFWVNNDAWVHSVFSPTGKTLGLSVQDIKGTFNSMFANDDSKGRFTGIGLNMMSGDFSLWNNKYDQISVLFDYWKERTPNISNQTLDNLFTMRLNDNGIFRILSDYSKNSNRQVLSIASYRVNDKHHVERFYGPEERLLSSNTYLSRATIAASDFLIRTFETGSQILRIGDAYVKSSAESPGEKISHATFDFSREDVRTHKLRQIEDFFTEERADVFELALIRSLPFFTDGEPVNQRQSAMTSFLREVNSLRNRLAPNTKLALRVPSNPTEWSELGIQNLNFPSYGIDILIITNAATTLSQYPRSISEYPISARPKDIFYSFMHQSSLSREYKEQGEEISRPLTRYEIATNTRVAYSLGYTGVDFFNFHYGYRFEGLGGTGLSTWYENSRCVVNVLCYELSPDHYVFNDYQNIYLKSATTYTLTKNFSMPITGWNKDGILRIVGNKTEIDLMGISTWKSLTPKISINGATLSARGDDSYFFTDASAKGGDSYWYDSNYAHSFSVPKDILRNGSNSITIEFPSLPASSRIPVVELRVN